ncbi:MAG: anthranilate phosphoribosyltransferase [Candidatus Omnitrophica bacterium]|nr:anthranilate phosphoribosyltransferase [Candidatus Omnitrophota bacterium]MDD5574284.1 anthranilate phosphoribosyltransferase [Candidatus Omnitrophota bacterium]
MIQDAVKKVSSGVSLSAQEMEAAMSQIAEGHVSEADMVLFLDRLAKKGETADEFTGAVRAMRRFVRPLNVQAEMIFDACGTGGDVKGTFNVSTVAAFVIAGAGVTVAKHGNRSVSSKCGSADLMEELGVNINAPVETIEKCLKEIGLAFLFAPLLHPAMAHVQPARRKLQTRTIFNVLGPLINPAFPTHQLVGVYDKKLLPVLGLVFKNLGIKHALVAWGEGGYDELITWGATYACEVAVTGAETHVKEYVIDSRKLDVPKADPRDVLGADTATNKQIALNILKGMEGPERDIVVLNAGCGLYVAGKANTIKDGMRLAEESVDSGAAIKKLNKLIEYTNL